MQTSIAEWVGQSAKRFGEKTAIVFEDRRWSFQDIDTLSSRLAASLEALGITRDQVVSIYSPNCPEWIISYYAILKIGAVVNPLNLMLTAHEAAFAVTDCTAVAIFSTSDKLLALQHHIDASHLKSLISFDSTADDGLLNFEALVDASPAKPDYPVAGISLGDTSTIGYTSGTTGHPKGAVLSHECILTNVSMTATMHVRSAADIAVSALPSPMCMEML